LIFLAPSTLRMLFSINSIANYCKSMK
jgi:hypothetical protein